MGCGINEKQQERVLFSPIPTYQDPTLCGSGDAGTPTNVVALAPVAGWGDRRRDKSCRSGIGFDGLGVEAAQRRAPLRFSAVHVKAVQG